MEVSEMPKTRNYWKVELCVQLFFSLANTKREIDEIKTDNYDDNDDDDKCDRREGKRDHNFERAQKEKSHV